MKQGELKSRGVSDVLIYAVHDGAVMDAWEKEQNISSSSQSSFLYERSKGT